MAPRLLSGRVMSVKPQQHLIIWYNPQPVNNIH